MARAIALKWPALLVSLLAAVPVLGLDPRDVTGAQDFEQLPRFPGAWISERNQQPETARRFVLGPVERKRREVRIDQYESVQARLETLTYELPRSTSLEDVVAHYQELLSGRIVYSCSGRDCGRSNDWANTVFSKADLYGPDKQQRYLAANLDDGLLGVYVIRRGNQRVFVHLAKYIPSSQVRLLPAPQALDDLVLFGRYPLRQISPDEQGQFSEADLAWLQQLGERLAELPVPSLFVVCHLHPARRPPTPDQRHPRRPEIEDQSEAVLALVQRSQSCASQAAEALAYSGGPKLLPFGVGPLAPTQPRPRSHLELILPSLD